MRIAYIAAGAGASYCGACHRDAALFAALGALGHEVLAIPLYTPMRTDDPVNCAPVFMGGLRLYLAERLRWLHLPQWAQRPLDHPALLAAVSRLAIQTRPAKLGRLTVSVLRGTGGPHAREIERLVHFLRHDFKPDLINLSNTLLASIAPPLRAALDVPIVSTLQGEESFIAALTPPWRAEAQALIRRHAASIDHFVSCAQERVAPLAAWLDVPEDRITPIPTGLDLRRYPPRQDPRASGPPVVGYLSSIRPEKGLDLLVDAAATLAREGCAFHLAIAGQVLDRRYWRHLQRDLDARRLDWHFYGELPADEKSAFLRRCDLFVLPTRLDEPRALVAMEALASAVPVIAPHRGALPELLARTGGGVTVQPDDASALARAIQSLLADPAAARRFGESGRQGIAAGYSPEQMARATLALYERLLGASTRQPGVPVTS